MHCATVIAQAPALQARKKVQAVRRQRRKRAWRSAARCEHEMCGSESTASATMRTRSLDAIPGTDEGLDQLRFSEFAPQTSDGDGHRVGERVRMFVPCSFEQLL